MLMHHSDIPYAVASEKAAAWAVKKFDKIIERGREQGAHLVKTLIDNQPRDSMYAHDALDFVVEGGRLAVKNPELGIMPFHNNAIGQACAKAKIPKAYMDTLLSDGQTDLLAQNFNERFLRQAHHKDGTKKKYRLRSVHNEVRGMVSDRYPLWDSNLLLQEFLSAVQSYGGMVVDAKCLDTKFSIKAIIPILYEPVANEIMLFGASLKNSDFGDGKYDISGVVARLRCTNLMTTESVFSKIHLGRRLDESIVFSPETYRKDTEVLALATRDIVKHYLSPKQVEGQVKAIQAANVEKINADTVLEALRNRGKLNKGEVRDIKEVFRSADVENLPAGNTSWRLSNALSFFAQSSEPSRALELESVAGEVAGLQMVKAAA